MNRRRLMGVFGALCLAVVVGLGADAAVKSNFIKPACACCGASCACTACTCDLIKADAVTGCDCCGTASCCVTSVR